MRVISRDQLKAAKGISYTDDHLRRMEKKGQFPESFSLGPGRVAYDEEEVDAWLKAKANARKKAPAAPQPAA
jgi:prophage regulatory protein